MTVDGGRSTGTAEAGTPDPATELPGPGSPTPFFDALIDSRRASAPHTVAVVYPLSRSALLAAADAHRAGLLVPVLVGPTDRIAEVARRAGAEVDGFQVIPAPDEESAASTAVDLVRSGRAELLMKGSLHTSAFLRAVLDRNSGLRGPRRASHVFVFDLPGRARPLMVTDAVVNVAPDLAQKADICRNAIELSHALGLSRPKVAVLSAIEVVDPAIPSTVDAAALAKMADREEIAGGTVDGPLALDDAISPRALAVKHIASSVGGEADVLVVPSLEAGNILYKSLVYVGGAEVAGIVVGLRVPLILTSRADTVRSRVASAALAGVWAEHHAPVLSV